ncbi:hypothetical protein SprV_0200549900 [Sparganum proliferum]
MRRYGDEEFLEIVEAVKLRRKSQSPPLITLCARSEQLEPMKEDSTTSLAESAVPRTNKGWSSDAENRVIVAAAPGDIYVKRLREWALDFKIAHAPIRALLAISKPIVPQLPADPRTLLGAAYDLKVAPMGSDIIMSQIPTRQLPARERKSAIDEAIYLLGGEGISSPEPQEDVNDSFETIPLGDEIPATVPKVDGNDEILLLMCKHLRELSMKMDILMESNRKLHGRLRFVESMVQQHAKAAGQITSQLPLNPIEHQLRSGSEFRNLNVQLLDPGFRKQLTSYLTCLGGHSLDEFVKRIFFAIFEDEISLHVNFKGRKTKERLSGSKLYEVILEVFAAWNTDATIKLSDLEAAITKRLKRSLDSYVQRKNKSIINREESDNTQGPSTDCRPPSTQ